MFNTKTVELYCCVPLIIIHYYLDYSMINAWCYEVKIRENCHCSEFQNYTVHNYNLFYYTNTHFNLFIIIIALYYSSIIYVYLSCHSIHRYPLSLFSLPPITIQVLIQTLVACGASVRWCACNIHSTQDEVAAALVEEGYPVYAWRGQTENDFWWCIEKCLEAPNWHTDMVRPHPLCWGHTHSIYLKFETHTNNITNTKINTYYISNTVRDTFYKPHPLVTIDTGRWRWCYSSHVDKVSWCRQIPKGCGRRQHNGRAQVAMATPWRQVMTVYSSKIDFINYRKKTSYQCQLLIFMIRLSR